MIIILKIYFVNFLVYKYGIVIGNRNNDLTIFDPFAGKEIQKSKTGLVVARYEFNRKTMFSVICPITSTVKNLPTRYSLPEDLDTNSQVLISQLESLNIKEKNLEKLRIYP